MKNQEKWQESRVVYKDGQFKINPDYNSIASRYIGRVILPCYVQTMQKYLKNDLLDLGCGQVPYYGIYKNNISSVTCVDWAVTNKEHDYLDFTMDLNEDLKITDGQFDSVLLADVLEHIYNPKELISEISRVLRPNGNLVVFVPFYYWIHSEPHDYHRYTEFALRRMTEECGLEILKLEPYGGYIDVYFDLINKYFIKRNWAVNFLFWFSKTLKRTNYYNKRAAFKNASFPLGYILVARKNELQN